MEHEIQCPHMSFPCAQNAPGLTAAPQCGIFVTTDKMTWMHSYEQKSIVYVKGHSGREHPMDFKNV